MDRKNKKLKAGSLKLLLIACFALATAQALAAGVELDGASNTGLETAPNGVPIVNIARPNNKGLSHNTYRKFNVDRPGLILNNSNRTVVNTQLGGQILGNTRLNAPAQVILNEVTSTNRSLLRGYTEVAGRAADVVIANPNGISVNGAGFINTPRITLTTGVPEIDGFGHLNGFDVRGGDIAIEGDGLNTELQDATSIYTHYLKLNASLHAQDLDVVLGKNRLDYPGRKIVSVGRGNSSRVLLDSSALGGMYAGKIVLVGTDQGLGMNLPPEVIASSGNIEITNAGRLVLQKIDASGDIKLRTSHGIDSKDSVYGGGNVRIEAARDLTVDSGMIGAAENLSIQADRVDNSALLIAGLDREGQLKESGELSVEAREVVNRNEIIASGRLEVDATDLANRGLFNAFGDLQISANELINEATMFSANDALLLVEDGLFNTEGATLFAINNMLLAGNEAGSPTSLISNDLGLIQTLQGDIDIYAQRFENLGEGELLYEKLYYDLGKGREVDTPLDAMNIDLEYSSGYTKHRNKARSRWVYEILKRLSRQAPLLYQDNAANIRNNRSARFLAIESRLVDFSTTDPAYLDSGNDLNLNVDEFLNYNSVTAAARDINFNISGDYLNEALSASEKVTDYQYSVRARHKDNWRDEDKYTSIGRAGYIPVSRTKTVSTNTVTHAGRDINGSIGGQAANSGVLLGHYQASGGIDPAAFSSSSIRLPSNDFGLFVRSKAPDSRYLIETNPRFTQFGNFVSSSYLLDRMDFSANATLKRLGDAFYESKLIRDSVFAQTGRRFLEPGIQTDNQQFQYLMDNALVAQHELELAPGIALRQDQINDLTRDIVWLEQQEIDGQQVLVPSVYLASGRKTEIHGGQIVAGRDTRILVAELSNNGLLEAGGDLAIESRGEIENRGVIEAGNELGLDAVGDVENVSGRIIGRRVSVESREGDIVNRRSKEEYVYSRRDLEFSTTHLGNAGAIEAQDSLTLEAAGEIEVSGSEVRGGDVVLKADTVDIGTSVVNENYFEGSKNNHVQEFSTRHFASSINGDEVVILSRGASRIRGSRLEAGQNLEIAAGNIEIGAVNDSDYYARLETEDKTFGESVRSRKSFRGKNIGSELNGTTVVLVTEHGDIEVSGSEIIASGSLIMDSNRKIRIGAGHDESLDETYEHETGWFSGNALYQETEDLEGRVTRKAVRTRIDAGRVNMEAQDDIDLSGVDISTDDSVTVTAQNISLRNTIDEDRTYSKHTEVTVTLDDLASDPDAADDLIEVEDGKLKLQLGSAVYDNAESTTRQTTVVASQVEADSIRFDTGSETHGNIAIEGSDMLAQDSIELNASGDVSLLDAHSEYVTEDLTRHGSAVVSWTFKNEYEQVARAIKAVRDAEEGLRQTRDDYDDYKKEVKNQQAELKRLKAQYTTGTGFIEQADINEFKRHLSRLEDDEEYYETNILLATATLASKTTALIQQIGKAASSSGTYGFNMGIDLDIDALENHFDEYYRESRASNLSANRLSISAGEDARIRGSNLLAGDGLDIAADNIDIAAGRSTRSSREREQQLHLSYSWDLMGGASSADPQDLGGNFSGEGSQQDSESRIYSNTQLLAENIRLEATGDTAIKGANVTAQVQLEIVTGNLDVSSVQDMSWSDSHSQGLSYSGAGAGANAADGYSESVQTLVTRLTGEQVEITVADHTDLQGAVIASVDGQGNDNGQLSLATNTLSAGSMNNSVDNDNRSLGIFGGETSTLDFTDDNSNSKTKSLATIGNGDISIGDVERSETRFLNTDIGDTEVAIFDIESHKGLSGELDIRLLSEEGRNEIAEDWLKTRMIGNTIELMATTERVGLSDFFKETDKTHKAYQAVKQQIANDPELAAMLQNSSLTPEQKQAMLDQVTDAVMIRLGLETHDNKIIATDENTPGGSQILGFYSEQTGSAYINDSEHDNTRDLLTTAGHEASHSIDHQSKIDNETPEDPSDNNIYSENFGENLASYTDFALDFHGHDGLAKTNDHDGNDSDQVKSNLNEFSSLDHERGDFRQLHSIEVEWIKKNAAQFAAFMCKKDECINREEAEKRLMLQAFNRLQFGTNAWDSEANSFLRMGQGVILPQDTNYTNVGPLTSFYAIPEQRANANIYVEELKKQLKSYKDAGITQPSLEQIIQDTKKYGEYSTEMSENLVLGSLAIGGLVLTPAVAGAPVLAEIVAFSKNPVGYCLANPAGCTLAAEEASYTVGGAISANSVVPSISKLNTLKSIEVVEVFSDSRLPQKIKILAESNITNSGETVLGHHPGYINKANSKGASYYDIGDLWNEISDLQREAANIHFLDKIASKGDQVYLSIPKAKIKEGSWLEWEVKYLLEHKNYVWVNQWSLKLRK